MGFGGAYSGQAYGGGYDGTNVHKFDTGLHVAQRTAIRRAAIAKLMPLLKDYGNYVRAIVGISIPSVTVAENDAGLIELANAVAGQTPAVVVALGRKVPAHTTDPLEQTAELTMTIYVVNSNQRGTLKGRLEVDVVGATDRAADPGLDATLEHVEQLLAGQLLPLEGTGELALVEEDFVGAGDDFTVWQQTYTLTIDRQINPRLRTQNPLITSLQGDHTLDGTPEGSDADPLVTTVAELEQED